MKIHLYLFIFTVYSKIFIEITHAIKRYVKLGYEIASDEDIEMAIKDLSGTHVANLQPNREQGEYIYIVLFL